MDWYYPVLGGAVTGPAARDRLAADWDRFVVPGLGARCVADRPWVTGAETCELALALAAAGQTDAALEQVAAMQHLRDDDGSYWTGLVFADGVRWPVERTTWTAAAVVLAADAIVRGDRGIGAVHRPGRPALRRTADGRGCGHRPPVTTPVPAGDRRRGLDDAGRPRSAGRRPRL